MAGFGSILGRALVGAAEGYGDYLTTQGKLQAEDAREEARSQRAMALEQFRAQLTEKRDEKLNENRRGEIVLTGMVNGRNNQAELETRGRIDAAKDDREFATWKAKNKIEFDQWKVKSGIELTQAKQLELFKSERKIEEQAREQGMRPVGNDVDEATGTRILFFRDAQGNIKQYDTNVVVQTKSETNPLTGAVTRTTTAPSKTNTGPGWRDQAGGGARSDVDVALDQLVTSYPDATPERYPLLFRNGRKISIEEAQAMVRRRLGG